MGRHIVRCRAFFAFLALASLVPPGRAFADAETWLFTGTNSSWSGSSGTTLTNDGSNLVATFASAGGAVMSNSITYSPATGANHDYIRLGYRITSGNIAQLRFNFKTAARANFSSPNLDIPITPDGGLHYLTFHVDHIGDWRSSTITQIRLLVLTSSGGGATGVLKLDFVAIRLDDRDPYAPAFTAISSDGEWTNSAVSVQVTGNDPPPNGFSGTTNPDKYASGVSSFGWKIGPGGSENWVGINGYDLIEGDATAAFSVPTSALSTGSNTLYLRSQDRCGRIGPSITATILFDPVGPLSPVITGVNPGGWTNDGVTISWSDRGDEGRSGVASFEYRIDGGSLEGLGYDLSVEGVTSTSGSHSFEVRAIDALDNAGAWSAPATFYYDAVPPSSPGAPIAIPASWTNVNSFSFTWAAASDGHSGVRGYHVAVNDGEIAFVTTTSYGNVQGVEGANSFSVWAEDVAGNLGDPQEVEFDLDQTLPSPPGNVTVVPPGYSQNSHFLVQWDASSDATSAIAGYRYSVGGGASQQTTATSVSVMAQAVGPAVVSVQALDLAGNVSGAATDSLYYYPAYLEPPALAFPDEGVAVRLPETFAWTPVSGAATYEIQVSASPTFATVNWSTATAYPNVLIPEAAAPAIGSGYSWRVRVLGSVPESPWVARTFIRTSNVAVPSVISLTSPADNSTVNGTTVLFQWSDDVRTSSYALDVSTDASFPPGVTISMEVVGASVRSVVVPPTVNDLYWRVTGRNSAGAGPASSTWHVAVSTAAGGSASPAILTPAIDVTVETDASLFTTGLVVGTMSGPITVEWVLDGVAFDTQTLQLDGRGIETPAVPVPTTSVGSHVLTLRLAATPEVVSAPRNITVVSPGTGAATHLVVIADEPQIIGGEATTVYATLRDDDNALVLTETGRTVNFSVTAGLGAVTPASAPMSAGVAASTYTSPVTTADLQLTATSASPVPSRPGVAAALAPVSGSMGLNICQNDLEKQRSLARAYIALLENLSWAGVPGGLDAYALPTQLDLTAARSFVNSTMDRQRLFRLNLVFRLLHRSYFYRFSPNMCATTPPEQKEIDGIATCIADEAASLARMFSVGLALAPGLSADPSWIKILKKTLGKFLPGKNDFESKWNERFAYAVNKTRSGTPGRRSTLLSQGASAKAKVQQTLRDENLLTETAVRTVLDVEWPARLYITQSIANEFIQSVYLYEAQSALNSAVNYLSHISTVPGSDAAAQHAVDDALKFIRGRTGSEHKAYVAYKGKFESWWFKVLTLVKYGNIFTGIERTMMWAAGADCGNAALECANLVGQTINLSILTGTQHSMFVPSSLIAASREALPLRNNVALRFLLSDPEAADSFERAARDLEAAVNAGDTVVAQQALDGYISTQASLENLQEVFGGAVLSVTEDAGLVIPGFEGMLDSASVALDSAATERMDARTSTLEWLLGPDSDSLQTTAVTDLEAAIDMTRRANSQLVENTIQVLGQTAVPFLVFTDPVVSRLAFAGDSVTIGVHVSNVGGAPADAPRVIVSGSTGEIDFIDGTARTLPTLAPGASADLEWRVRPTFAFAEAETVATTFVTVTVDTGSVPGSAGSIGVRAISPLLASTPAPELSLSRLVIAPNPSGGITRFSTPGPRAGFATVDVFDVRGRLIWSRSGRGDLEWDGRNVGGQRTHAGVYFARVRSGGETAVQRFVRIN